MSKLREEMIRAMKLRNFSNKTQGAYLYQIMKLAGHYGRSPDQLTHKELQGCNTKKLKNLHKRLDSAIAYV